MVGRGIRPGPSRSQHPRQGLVRLIQKDEQWVEPEPPFCTSASLGLFSVCASISVASKSSVTSLCQSRRPHPWRRLGSGGVHTRPPRLVDLVQKPRRGLGGDRAEQRGLATQRG
jgi:hypothetical protein